MNAFTLWFNSKKALLDLIACLSNKNMELENQLRRKSLAFDKTIEDNALQHSFMMAQIEKLNKELSEAKPSFTLPNGVKLVAEHNSDDLWDSIDIVAHAPNGRFEMMCCADYEHDGGLRVLSYNGRDEKCLLDYDFSYLLGKDDIDPDIELDYIDQVMQEKADRESAKEV